MKKLVMSVALVLWILPAAVHAQSTSLLICEVQTESVASASEEYIKLCNNSTDAIDLLGWHVQYYSANVTSFSSPTRNIALTGVLQPNASTIVASTGYMTDVASASFGATLAATGGHIRLINALSEQIDVLGWGSAKLPETTAADIVAKGEIYKRQLNGSIYVDTDNNQADFSAPIVVDIPVPPISDVPLTEQQIQEPVLNNTQIYSGIVITELLPDPASPVADTEGEFVELFNTNDQNVSLEGFVLQTGANNSYSYTFHSETLQPKQYKAYYVTQTRLTLSNTEGKARLLSPAGDILDETAAYGKAVTGESWILNGEVWQWTSRVTPNSENIASTPQNTQTAKAVKNATTVTPKAKTASVKGATKTSSSAANSSAKKTSYLAPQSDKKPLPVNPFVLAGVGVIAIGYMIYEYRNDIANKLALFRRNRSGRRSIS